MPDFEKLITRLEAYYGTPARPPARGPLELIFWENACYLLPDARRAEIFEGLRTRVGLEPHAILKAPWETLFELARRGGMRPEVRVERWREIARITLDRFGGDLNQILAESFPKAKQALKAYPTIGDPGAEKILLFCGVYPGLALESNGLRVLTRVGYGQEQKNYAAAYRSVQQALKAHLPEDAAYLTRAHLLLRQHGQKLCCANGPDCGACPVVDLCQYPKSGGQRL